MALRFRALFVVAAMALLALVAACSSGNLVQDPDLLNIPLAISARQVNYYLPKLPLGTHVKLDGPVLAGMYLGTIKTWNDAVADFVSATPPNETISMVNGPAPRGYPIVNYEYAIGAAHQPNPATARAIKAFLHWVITTGNSPQYLPAVFQPLPASIVQLADAQIGEIK